MTSAKWEMSREPEVATAVGHRDGDGIACQWDADSDHLAGGRKLQAR